MSALLCFYTNNVWIKETKLWTQNCLSWIWIQSWEKLYWKFFDVNCCPALKLCEFACMSAAECYVNRVRDRCVHLFFFSFVFFFFFSFLCVFLFYCSLFPAYFIIVLPFRSWSSCTCITIHIHTDIRTYEHVSNANTLISTICFCTTVCCATDDRVNSYMHSEATTNSYECKETTNRWTTFVHSVCNVNMRWLSKHS